MDRTKAKDEIRLAVEASDRFQLRQLEQTHKDGKIRAAIRAADNFLVAKISKSAAQIEILGHQLLEKWEAL